MEGGRNGKEGKQEKSGVKNVETSSNSGNYENRKRTKGERKKKFRLLFVGTTMDCGSISSSSSVCDLKCFLLVNSFLPLFLFPDTSYPSSLSLLPLLCLCLERSTLVSSEYSLLLIQFGCLLLLFLERSLLHASELLSSPLSLSLL